MTVCFSRWLIILEIGILVSVVNSNNTAKNMVDAAPLLSDHHRQLAQETEGTKAFCAHITWAGYWIDGVSDFAR